MKTFWQDLLSSCLIYMKGLKKCPSAWSLSTVEKYGFQEFETPILFSKRKGFNIHSCLPVCLLDVLSEH